MLKIDKILDITNGKLIQKDSSSLDLEISGISIDTRTIFANELFVALKGNNFDGHDFLQRAADSKASCLLIDNEQFNSPDLSIPIILVNNSYHALAAIANHIRNKFNPKVVVVTGSNGKTSTKDIIHHLLSYKFNCLKNEGTKNNHVGLPLTLLKIQSETEYVIAEIGTNHPGEIDYLSKMAEPDMAVITNIGNSHLEFFHNKENILAEKSSLIKNLKSQAKLIINQDDDYLNKIDYSPKLTFGLKNKSDFTASKIEFSDQGYNFLLNDKLRIRVNILGRHNIYNVLAAIAAANSCGISFENIRERLKVFRLPDMRSELVELNGIKIINDAYNANPDSFRSAIDSLLEFSPKCRKIVVTGDMLELGDNSADLHKGIGQYIAEVKEIALLISVGKFAKDVVLGAKENGMQETQARDFNTFEEARQEVISRLEPDDILLIKGSRAMQMERFVQKIREEFS